MLGYHFQGKDEPMQTFWCNGKSEDASAKKGPKRTMTGEGLD